MKASLKISLTILGLVLGLWLLAELGMRAYLELPLKTDFYSSLSQENIRVRQEQVGVRTVSGAGWVHLGWIADPERESYRIESELAGQWQTIGTTRHGSYLLREVSGLARVWAIPNDGRAGRILGVVTAEAGEVAAPPIFAPHLAGSWQLLFRPTVTGAYINDHTLYRDAENNWRLVGITDHSDGDYNSETYFAVGESPDFPPSNGMQETAAIADFGSLAWAPHVIESGPGYEMFWSPHMLHQMSSQDGIHWSDHRITMPAPYRKFFRDPMVLEVGEGQWLLYTTARSRYYSAVDIYQSFNLEEWQYIRSALNSGWSSERNSPFGSMESPFIARYQGRFYLSFTYNNDSFFWPGILLLFRYWPDPGSYNETLVLQADNPYDFGTYRGRERTGNLVASLEAHAPEMILHPDTGQWYVTTAGWPWVATLTSGEVAVAKLEWIPANGPAAGTP